MLDNFDCSDPDRLDVIQVIAAFDREISHLTFGEIAKSALRFMATRLQIARASIALLRSDVEGFLLFDSTIEVTGVESGKCIPPGSASLSQTVSECRSIYRADLRAWPIKNAVDEAFIAHGLSSTLSVPLVACGNCIGSLNAAATAIDGIGVTVRQVIELVAPRLAFALAMGMANQALLESEKRFRDIFETVGDGIVVAERSSRKILMVNEAICKMLRCDSTALLGQTIAALHPQDRLEEVIGMFVAMVEGRTDNALEIPMLRADGSAFLADVSARNTTIASRRCVVGVFRDAARRQCREEEQLQTQKLESIRTLAAGLAHDFNNLLTGIIGNVSLAQGELNESDPAWPLLDDAQNAANRATALTRQLLTFAKGGAPLRGRVNVLQVLRDAANISTLGSNVQCQIQLPSERYVVAGDAGQLAQVFQNVVRNAVDAMPAGGTIHINVTTVDAAPGGEIRIEISDQGCGIQEQVQDQIYTPFFTTKDHHSGLGLSVAYSILRNHGGRIQVTSRVGVGSTFCVVLPLIEDSELLHETPMPKRSAAHKILIMDDEAIVLNVAERALQRRGYMTKTATNGGDAVALYRDAIASGAPFDAVILDLTVPGGMGGREAAGQILSIDPHARLMVSSGYSEDSVMAEYEKHGFSAVLPKPYGATQLCDAVQAMLRGDLRRSAAG